MTRAELQRRITSLSAAQRMALAQALADRGLETPGETRLVAYLQGDVDADVVLADLRERLPAAMVPSECVVLERLPRNANGKVDRSALPAPEPAPVTTLPTAPRDETERTLASMWTDLLGTEPGPEDSFWDLGGHSLLALRLTSAIQREFGIALPVAAVFQYPTLAGLADLLRRRDADDLSGAVVPIRATGPRDPLFCVHCVNGRVTQYYKLAETLGEEQPVYGLQPPSMDGLQEIPGSLPEIAARHVTEIRKIQPRGPYHLCGYSFGGLLAFEMAQQLTAAGETVATLAMFDTVLLRQENVTDRAERHRDRVAGLNPLERLAYLARSAFGNVRTLVRTARQRLATARTERRIRWHREHRVPLPVELREPFVRRGLRAAMYAYHAQPYPGSIILFRAGEQTWMSQEYPNLGWDGIPAGGLRIEDIDGGHGALLGDEVVETVRRLRPHLDGGR